MRKVHFIVACKVSDNTSSNAVAHLMRRALHAERGIYDPGTWSYKIGTILKTATVKVRKDV